MSLLSVGCAKIVYAPTLTEEVQIKLPEPRYDSDVSFEQSLLHRRSIRNYTDDPLTIKDVSQLLWAAQGITDPRGFRTAPSAGVLYPIEVKVVVGDVEGLLSTDMTQTNTSSLEPGMVMRGLI